MTTEDSSRPPSPKARRALVMAITANVLVVAIGLIVVLTEEALIVRLLGALFIAVAAVSGGYFVRRLRGRGQPRRFETDSLSRLMLGNGVLQLLVLLLALVLLLVF